MITEPFYIVQSHVPKAEQLTWLHKEIQKAKDWVEFYANKMGEQPVFFMRVSHHLDNSELLLFEAWDHRPEDQGEQRWSVDA